MFKFIIMCLFLVYMICAIVAVFTFIIDTFRWHKREEHIKIVPSAAVAESEVIENERRDNGRAPGRGDNNDNGSSDRDSNGDNNISGDNFF